MVITLINYKIIIRNFVIVFIIFIGLVYCNLSNAIGSEADLKMYRDKGVIGEKKTLQEGKVYYEPTTGSTFHFPKKGTFVTPQVSGKVAYFDLNGMYNFRFECLNWRYSIAAYWSSPDVAEERVGFLVSLESPDKGTFIEIKEVDISVSGSLSTSATQEQLSAIQLKGYVEDSFINDERVLAAQQAIRWILDKNLDNYGIIEQPIKFSSENIGNKLFVKTEINVFSKKENIIKKYAIWALNCRGYRFKRKTNVRWSETWICELIADSSNYSSAITQVHMILETFKFDTGRNVYQDIKD